MITSIHSFIGIAFNGYTFLKYVKLADESIIIFGLATQPGRFLVDSFPIRKCTLLAFRNNSSGALLMNSAVQVKYVPAWMPGAGFKRIGAQWREKIMLNVNAPFEKVKNDMVRPCLL